MPTPLVQQSEVNSIHTFVSNSRVALKPGKRNVERWDRKPETPEQKTRNVERWNRKSGTPERKTRNAGTENQERRNRKPGKHF